MRAVHRVVARLENVREVHSGEFRAKCPAHRGKSRGSLAIKDAGDRALVHCFAGCRTHEILNSLGLDSLRELFDDAAKRQRPQDPEAIRQQRVNRGLRIWSEQRLVEVCQQLREIDAALNGFVSCVELHTDPGATELAFDLIKLRDRYDNEFEILTHGDLDDIKHLWQAWRNG